MFYSLTDGRLRAIVDALRATLDKSPQMIRQAASVPPAMRPAFTAKSVTSGAEPDSEKRGLTPWRAESLPLSSGLFMIKRWRAGNASQLSDGASAAC